MSDPHNNGSFYRTFFYGSIGQRIFNRDDNHITDGRVFSPSSPQYLYTHHLFRAAVVGDS
jgi:hypothetical protein